MDANALEVVANRVERSFLEAAHRPGPKSFFSAMVYDLPVALGDKISWLAPLLARLTVGWVFATTGWGKLHGLQEGDRLLRRPWHPLPADPGAVCLGERVRLRRPGASRVGDTRRVDSADRGAAGGD